MTHLKAVLEFLESGKVPPLWLVAQGNIESERKHFDHLLRNPDNIVYGANTHTGHMDGQRVSESNLVAFQKEIILSHAIGWPPYYDKHVADCVSAARIQAWAMGGSGISAELYCASLRAVQDDAFYPKIPKSSSYSCGDVITGAHWAKGLLSYLDQGSMRAGEALALINGSFVHVGCAVSSIRKLSDAWALFVQMTACSDYMVHAHPSNYEVGEGRQDDTVLSATISLLRGSLAKKGRHPNPAQDPISVRAVPQVMDALCTTVVDFMLAIDKALARPSGNPLVRLDSENSISQASFIAPLLAIKTGAVIEALLFAMWAVQGRICHLLSGKIPGVPADGVTDSSMLGLIQYPKMLMAILEKARLNCGRRIYASGSSTSYGVEDLWSNGVLTLEQLEDLLEDFFRILAIELYVMGHVAKNSAGGSSDLPFLALYSCIDSVEGVYRDLRDKRERIYLHFPNECDLVRATPSD